VFVPGAGAFTLNGNSIALAGNVVNSSASTQTVNIAMSLGGNRSFNGNAGQLNVAGWITNTAANTLTLVARGVLANAMTHSVWRRDEPDFADQHECQLAAGG